MARPPPVLRLVEPEPQIEDFDDIVVDVPSNEIAPGVSLENGVLHVEHDDGSTTIDFDPKTTKSSAKDDGFYANLVDQIPENDLNSIASSLMDAIERDKESRKEWMETEARGIQLLGLKLEEPRGDLGTSSAPLEGMSSVRHPLLLEATVNFQATAVGEFLPAGGPVKVRDDTPMKSPSQELPPGGVPGLGAAGAGSTLSPFDVQGIDAGLAPANVLPFPGPPGIPGPIGAPVPPPPINPAQLAAPTATEVAQPPSAERDSLAAALEKDFNHYLTVVADEYVPDSDRMYFGVAFRGDGFKKIYNCPLKQRPVIAIIDTKDLIVSNNAGNIDSCGRITHRIKMPRSTLKRMQYLGVYADVDLSLPAQLQPDVVETQINETEGYNPKAKKPEDEPYEIYESYCELDELDDFAPKELRGNGLPLPYRVTIETTSRKVLSVIRNWKENDPLAMPKQFFVQFPFIRGLGFYGYGFIHLLGNTTSALTAMWREMLDAGMFSNFPGFLYDQAMGRQLTNQMRVPPGGGLGVQVPAMKRIQDSIMPVPYKEPGAAFTGFAQWVEQGGQRLGQTAQIAVGEGKQDAPVGTTLALIEQATKMLNAVHKRLHGAQDKEFQLLKERFREDPEAFWRHNNKPSMPWEKEQFLKALDNYNLVPVSDPNNPTSLHRTMKAAVVEGLAQKYPQHHDQMAALRFVYRVAGIDSEGILRAQPLPPPPDPRMEAIKAKGEQTAMTMRSQQETAIAKSMKDMVVALKQLEDNAKDRESQERLEMMRQAMERMKMDWERGDVQREVAADMVKRASEMRMDELERQQQQRADAFDRMHEARLSAAERVSQQQADLFDRAHEARVAHHSARQDHEHEEEKHRRQMERDEEAHQAKMKHEKELNDEKIRVARAMARATPKKKDK